MYWPSVRASVLEESCWPIQKVGRIWAKASDSGFRDPLEGIFNALSAWVARG